MEIRFRSVIPKEMISSKKMQYSGYEEIVNPDPYDTMDITTPMGTSPRGSATKKFKNTPDGFNGYPGEVNFDISILLIRLPIDQFRSRVLL